MNSTVALFKREKAADSPHSRKKKRHSSCHFHPHRMRQQYGPLKRSGRIIWSQLAAASTPYHMNTSAGRLISGQRINAWRFFTITRGSRPMQGVFSAVDPVYVPDGVTLLIMKKASCSGRKISVRQPGPLFILSSTRTGLLSRDIKAARP